MLSQGLPAASNINDAQVRSIFMGTHLKGELRNVPHLTESPSKRGSQRTLDPALRVRRHGVSSGEHRPFRGHFRPKHDELAGVQGINLFVSSSSITFLFVSLNFVEYWKSYTHLNLTQFPASPTAFKAFSGQTTAS
ncbi:hypothetical protein DVH24_008033 [Malus domestica]|uniref:Uncharacterized protein n=1 Tax=Malus domestica TaxID=3750 RepID=A0A498JNX9_MALDO|nr:hypothetical protein DVH24_008033 [Malus domestica]